MVRVDLQTMKKRLKALEGKSRWTASKGPPEVGKTRSNLPGTWRNDFAKWENLSNCYCTVILFFYAAPHY